MIALKKPNPVSPFIAAAVVLAILLLNVSNIFALVKKRAGVCVPARQETIQVVKYHPPSDNVTLSPILSIV